MAFKTTDFKKTSRTTDGQRVLYPYQIKDDRYTASIGYAIAYYERMVGRRRAEFEAETLLEFFGDPRLARGLVACLARTYAWREQSFADALGDDTARSLWRAGLTRPADLRAKLYGLANGRYGGVILPHERAEALEFLCARIGAGQEARTREPENQEPRTRQADKETATDQSAISNLQSAILTPAQFERALTLDSEEQHVLVKLGPTPEPSDIVALYNYHSLETALCHADVLRLRLRGPVWNIIRSAHNLARRYRLRYEVSGAPRTLFDDRIELALHGGQAAGKGMRGANRAGRRIVRALLRLLTAHPDSLSGGEALVELKGQKLTLKLDGRAVQVLGIAARQPSISGVAEISEPWDEDIAATFQKAWGRAYVRGRTAGWRLRRDPEPLIGEGAMVVPDFAMVRGSERLALCLTTGIVTTEALTRDLSRLGGGRTQALAIVPSHAAEGLRTCPVPLATYSDRPAEAIGALVATLERKHPRRRPEQTLTPWQQLEHRVAEEGFVEEQTVAALMGCQPEEAAKLVQRWGGAALHALPGLGVCAPESLDEIRQLIEENELRQRAA
jgi:predicted nuclease of restriction endonuclease-like RecB superfamily